MVSLVDKVNLKPKFSPRTGMRGPIVAHSKKAVQHDKWTAGSDNFTFKNYRHTHLNRLISLTLRTQLKLVAVALNGVFKPKIQRICNERVPNRDFVKLGQ